MKPEDVKMFACGDCNMNTAPTVGNEFYIVTDAIWQEAQAARDGILCIGCLEQRIGRKLESADFPNLPINFIFPRSRRLALRLKRPYFGPKRRKSN